MLELPGFVLPIMILASAVGALTMCAVLLRYGLIPETGEPLAMRRRRARRLGFTIAAACLGLSAVLSMVVLAQVIR